MSAKKNKRKAVRHNHQPQHKSAYPKWLKLHPRLSLGIGMLLILSSLLLLTIGYVSDARVGLSMMSLFFGVSLVIFAKAVLPKKSKLIK